MARPADATPERAEIADWHGDYLARRDQVAAHAAGSDAPPTTITYTDQEHDTWCTVLGALNERWERVGAPELLAAGDRLSLPTDRIPQLSEVSAALRPRTGVEYRAVPGLVPVNEFFGALAAGRFLSTQYIRHHRSPLYTPEPDIIHEVVGHGTCLAQPHLAMIHRQAGSAMLRMRSKRTRQFVADVFWFSIEFGVVMTSDGPRAHGAGLLSSVGELDWFVDNAAVRPVNVDEMAALRYDIERYQPVLFGVRSLDELLDTVGEFFATASHEQLEARCDQLNLVA